MTRIEFMLDSATRPPRGFAFITMANLMTDRSTGRPRGFAFVTVASPEEAQKAIDAMNGATLDGRISTYLYFSKVRFVRIAS